MHVNQRHGLSIAIDLLSWFIKDFIKEHNELMNHG
jgi:hypothetical protein